MPKERIPSTIVKTTVSIGVLLVLGVSYEGASANELRVLPETSAASSAVAVDPFELQADSSWTTRLIIASNLVRHSSADAENVCTKLLEDALLEHNAAAAAVATINRACARMQMYGIQKGVDDFRSAFRLFPSQTEPAMEILFLQGACRYERFLGRRRHGLRIAALKSRLNRDVAGVPDELLTQAHYEVLVATGSDDSGNRALFRMPVAGANVRLNDSLAMVRVCLIRKQLESGDLSSPEALQGSLYELTSVLPHLRLSESIIEHALLAADIAREIDLAEVETAMLDTAVRAAFTLNCQTLVTRCQLRRDGLSTRSRRVIDHNKACRTMLNVVNQINDRDLLRNVVRAIAESSQTDAAGLVSSCIQRILDLNAIMADTSVEFPAKTSAQLESLVQQKSEDLASHLVAAERENSRSLFVARAGFVVLCGLALVLLRERWNLRQINQRLKAEIEQNERQRVEQERMELRLAQTERLESLGAIAGGIAHDFNNLLVGVIGNADLLKRETSLSLSATTYIDGIIRSAETAAELSHKMLAYAGRQASSKRTVELNALIQRMLPLFRAGLGTRHLIQFSTEAEQLYTEADVAQLEQIAMNLVTNAFQAMGDHQGTIQLRTGSCVLDEIPVNVMTIGNRKEGGRFIWLEVTDSGPGIPAHVQARIFEPFFSTKRQTTGHGFGLSVVYGHINRHHGLIQLYSVEGHGTTFRVLLPMCENAEGPRSEERCAVVTPRVQYASDVLIVDDRRDVLDVLEHTLASAGLRPHAFTSSTEALEFLLDHPNAACLLLDIMMPEVDGITMLQEMAQRDLRIPVIVMSGFSPASPETFREFSSVRAVVQKPFRPENILGIVLQTIEEQNTASTNLNSIDSAPAS